MASSVVDLARTAAVPGDPRQALAAIAALRTRLEELEEYHVETAVARGMSWTDVGAALGVTKQAAHKRFSGRLGRRDPGARRRMTVTGEARQAVRFARAEAAAAGRRTLAPTHLLVGLLQADGAARRALERVGLDIAQLRAAIRRDAAALDPSAVTVSARTRLVFERALSEAVALGDAELRGEHLLLAVMEHGGVPVRRLLATTGVDREDVRGALASQPR